MRNIQLKPTMTRIGVFAACGALAAGVTLVARSGVLKGARCAALGEREQARLTNYARESGAAGLIGRLTRGTLIRQFHAMDQQAGMR